MLKTNMWKTIVAMLLVVAIVTAMGSIAVAAPKKKIDTNPVVQMIDVNLLDQHFYHTINGTVSVENPNENQMPGVVLELVDETAIATAQAVYKEMRKNKAIFTFQYQVTDKRMIAKGIYVKAAFLKKDGTVDRMPEQTPLFVGAGITDVALGTANIDVMKDTFNWNTNTATFKVVTKLTKLRTMQVFYLTNDLKTWKNVAAKKTAENNGLAVWTVTMPVSMVTTQLKLAVAYKMNGKTMVDRTNQDAWTWIRE